MKITLHKCFLHIKLTINTWILGLKRYMLSVFYNFLVQLDLRDELEVELIRQVVSLDVCNTLLLHEYCNFPRSCT